MKKIIALSFLLFCISANAKSSSHSSSEDTFTEDLNYGLSTGIPRGVGGLVGSSLHNQMMQSMNHYNSIIHDDDCNIDDRCKDDQ